MGVDLATGVTLRGTWLNNKIARRHPDTTNAGVDGVQLPNWSQGLRSWRPVATSCRARLHRRVDMVLDQEKGPLILELNASARAHHPDRQRQRPSRHRCHAVEARLENGIARRKASKSPRRSEYASSACSATSSSTRADVLPA
ncbi:sugar-transfer associated ATP-grasp domain-containing protein [Pseudomonas aeruginosa]